MKLKIDENGHAVLDDGKPVYVHDDGKELPYDAVHSTATIKRLHAEAKAHREAKEQFEAQLKAFEGLDPDAARKAFETLKDVENNRLVDAGQMEKVKQQMQEAFDQKLRGVEAQYKPYVEKLSQVEGQLHGERLSAAFGRSQFIKDKVAIPVDFVQSKFGSHFSVGEDGRIRAKGADGSTVLSRAKPGEEAGFDEALELFVEAHPQRDYILKGTGASGGGANGSRTGADGKRTVTRAAFDAMDPAEQSSVASAAAKGAAVIVD